MMEAAVTLAFKMARSPVAKAPVIFKLRSLATPALLISEVLVLNAPFTVIVAGLGEAMVIVSPFAKVKASQV